MSFSEQIASGLIKQWEQCRLTAYLDSGGVPTIGWGACGPGIELGMTWTQDQADTRFEADFAKHAKAAKDLLTVSLNPNQEAAWASIIYNCGAGKSDGKKGDLADSDLLAHINRREWFLAAKEWTKWHFDNGKPVLGLFRRRLDEAALFLRP